MDTPPGYRWWCLQGNQVIGAEQKILSKKKITSTARGRWKELKMFGEFCSFSSTFSFSMRICLALKISPTSSFSLISLLLRAHWFNIVHFSFDLLWAGMLFRRFFTREWVKLNFHFLQVYDQIGISTAHNIFSFTSSRLFLLCASLSIFFNMFYKTKIILSELLFKLFWKSQGMSTVKFSFFQFYDETAKNHLLATFSSLRQLVQPLLASCLLQGNDNAGKIEYLHNN